MQKSVFFIMVRHSDLEAQVVGLDEASELLHHFLIFGSDAADTADEGLVSLAGYGVDTGTALRKDGDNGTLHTYLAIASVFELFRDNGDKLDQLFFVSRLELVFQAFFLGYRKLIVFFFHLKSI